MKELRGMSDEELLEKRSKWIADLVLDGLGLKKQPEEIDSEEERTPKFRIGKLDISGKTKEG